MENDFKDLSNQELKEKLKYYKIQVQGSAVGSDTFTYYSRFCKEVTKQLKLREEELLAKNYDCLSGDYNPQRLNKRSDYYDVLIVFAIVIFVGWCSYYKGYVSGFDDSTEIRISKSKGLEKNY